MPIEISSELEEFVENEVALGRFADRNSVIEHALRLLQRDRLDAVLGVKAGLADVEAGKLQTIDDAFSELHAELGIGEDE